jgi:hypothetical protein
MVDLGDITDVARLVLTDTERHAGATYELVAPGRYTGHQLGEIISRVLDRHIPVREIDADTYLKAWIGDTDPAEATHQIRVLRAIIPLQQPRLRRQSQRPDPFGLANAVTRNGRTSSLSSRRSMTIWLRTRTNARSAGFEPATGGLEVHCSIR